MISDAAKEELKIRNPCDVVVARFVKLRKRGRKMIGPCPLHSPRPEARDSTAFECDADGWVCAVCHDGGDVFKLVMLREQIDFPAAVAWLGGAEEPDADRAVALRRERQARHEKSQRDANAFRERERSTVYEIWKGGIDVRQSEHLQRYLKDARGLEELPESLKLRCVFDMPYYVAGVSDDTALRAPCMLAPIVDADGTFRALHMTWLDAQQPKGKALIRDPKTGDPLSPKKVRGSKAGNVIRLVDAVEPRQLFIGEGIETVLSVWLALHQAGRDLAGVAFWSAVDLGNLGGRALDTVPHPTLRDARGRVRNVPGPEPDPESTVIAVPDSVTELVLLGDGDSDRFITQCTLARAARRYASSERAVTVAWAPDGKDFNDELRETA